MTRSFLGTRAVRPKWQAALLLAGVLAIVVGTGLQTVSAAPRATASPLSMTTFAVARCQPKDFFGLVPWYNYMQEEIPDSNTCDIECFNVFPQAKPNSCHQTKSDIPGILLAIIDDLLRIAGLVAVAFVIVGAFQYVESRGNSERAARAQSSIINALIGLVITIIAVGLISFLGSRL